MLFRSYSIHFPYTTLFRSYLVEKKVKLVGIDYFGCEAKGSPGHPVHTTLLKNNVVILEGINLLSILPGKYEKIGRATSELQSRGHLVCRLLLEKKKKRKQ